MDLQLETAENSKIKGGLHWAHWFVVGASLVLTFAAWYISKTQIDEKVETRFQQESQQVIELILERLHKYEDALRSGASAIQSHGGDVTHKEWEVFASNLKIEHRYPGINGIGVIFHVPKQQLGPFLKKHRKVRKDFKIYPQHNNNEFWPITYIEPLETNYVAVGLDMAHEKNRYTASLKARDTGEPQITGPIELVQFEEKTPGFLFKLPYYSKENLQTVEQRRQHFKGIVYAPFVVKNLMKGALEYEKRHVSIKISDKTDVMYDESTIDEINYDSSPLFKTSRDVELYGRTWGFQIQSNKAFRSASGNSQPWIILIGGIIIDSLLLFIFYLLSQSNKRALKIVNQLSKETNERRLAAENASKMATLGQMAGGIAHEINNPLSIITGYSSQLEALAEDEEIDRNMVTTATKKITETSHRIAKIVKGLKAYSRDASAEPKRQVSLKKLLEDVIPLYSEKFKSLGIKVEMPEKDLELMVLCRPVEISQVLINLINNSYDAIKKQEKPWIQLEFVQTDQTSKFIVTDSGPGIPKDVSDRILEPFFTTKPVGKGTGLGLSICVGLVKKHGGKIYLDPDCSNTRFVIELPNS